MGEQRMLAVGMRDDPALIARGRDNFLVFAAELEVYAAAAVSLHVCTQCPKGSVDVCSEALRRIEATGPPRAMGLASHWVVGGTG